MRPGLCPEGGLRGGASWAAPPVAEDAHSAQRRSQLALVSPCHAGGHEAHGGWVVGRHRSVDCVSAHGLPTQLPTTSGSMLLALGCLGLAQGALALTSHQRRWHKTDQMVPPQDLHVPHSLTRPGGWDASSLCFGAAAGGDALLPAPPGPSIQAQGMPCSETRDQTQGPRPC